MSAHPWDEQRPLSAWLPGGLCDRNRGRTSRIRRPVLDTGLCVQCDLCWLYCPEGCITRGEAYVIDYGFCKGCGICARECPKHAIAMEKEPGL